MRRVSLQQRLRMIILIFLMILFVILGGILYPSIRGILSLQEEIDATEIYLESQYQRARRARNGLQQIAEINSSTLSYDELAVPQNSELFLIETFERLAEQHGIEQHLSVSSKPATKERPFPHYEFTFLNHGPFDHQIAYLHELLQSPYVVHISRIDMQVKKIGSLDEPDQSTFRFSAYIYVQ